MIIKSITQVGNPIIRKKSKRITTVVSPKIKKIIKDLIDTMRFANLVGISAPQIGHNLRIFVTEIRTTTLRKTNEVDKLRVYINPRIIDASKKRVAGYEGCGSVASAGIFGKVSRPNKITIEAVDEKNKRFVFTARGLLSRVIQHEIDHLDGVIFLDKVSDNMSLMSREEYLKV